MSLKPHHFTSKMSITRLVLVLSQAVLNQMACTPPNPTPEKHRYHTKEPYILQIAPTIFKVSYEFKSQTNPGPNQS